MTDQQQQQKVNEAAEKFTDALVQSYKVAVERSASAQEQNVQLTETFFNQTINNLRAQAEENRRVSQELQGQQQRQAEAVQTLTQESVEAYMEFLNSAFSFWQRGARETEQATRR